MRKGFWVAASLRVVMFRKQSLDGRAVKKSDPVREQRRTSARGISVLLYGRTMMRKRRKHLGKRSSTQLESHTSFGWIASCNRALKAVEQLLWRIPDPPVSCQLITRMDPRWDIERHYKHRHCRRDPILVSGLESLDDIAKTLNQCPLKGNDIGTSAEQQD